MSNEPVVLVMAVGSLVTGLSLYLWISTGPRQRHFKTTNLISWLLIALFPVLLIFSFFPDSTFSGQIKGISTGGAIGAFIFIWWYGTRSGLTAARADEYEARLAAKDKEIASLRKRLRKPKVLQDTLTLRYEVKGAPGKAVGLVTGNLNKVDFVDVWVNSENTNMQMASYFDRSVSGTIRYLGSVRDKSGAVRDDVVADALRREMADCYAVTPGTALVTEAGELARTHKVKRIVHVAAVQGQPGVGYRAIEDIGCCVKHALEAVDQAGPAEAGITSIVFPLLGAGQGRGELATTVDILVGAAVDFLRSRPHSSITTVYFLAYTDVELGTAKEVLERSEALMPKADVTAPAASP